MLTKRTNILFDENLWRTLVEQASKRRTSVGKLVREAVMKMYAQDEELEERKKALEQIFKIRKVSRNRIDYKALINYGRKY